MTYVCDACRKPFRLEEPVTFEDMRNHRLLSHDGKFWHIPCAHTAREDDGGLKVVEPLTGQLVRQNGSPH